MTLSLTAPAISEEAERAEKAALTDEERQRIQDDVHGGHSSPDSRTSCSWKGDIKRGVELVEEEISQMEDCQKADYNLALQRAPVLVHTESNISKFLSFDNGDTQATAKRVVEYWKIRREIFGIDRAFLPMTLDGAMAEDVPVLQTGIVTILPQDAYGRPVMFVKRSEITAENGSREAFARCYFYFYTVLAASKSSGFVLLAYIKDGDLFKLFNRWLIKRNIAAQTVLPVTSRSFHLINRTPNWPLRKLLLPILKHMIGKHNRHRMLIHVGDDHHMLLPALESYGMKSANLTQELGGSLVAQDYAHRWVTEQRGREQAAAHPVQESTRNAVA